MLKLKSELDGMFELVLLMFVVGKFVFEVVLTEKLSITGGFGFVKRGKKVGDFDLV